MVMVIVGCISMTVVLYGCSWSYVSYIYSNDMKKFMKEEKLLNHICMCMYIYTHVYTNCTYDHLYLYGYLHEIARCWICLHLRVYEYSYTVVGIHTYIQVYRHT